MSFKYFACIVNGLGSRFSRRRNPIPAQLSGRFVRMLDVKLAGFGGVGVRKRPREPNRVDILSD